MTDNRQEDNEMIEISPIHLILNVRYFFFIKSIPLTHN